MSDDFGILPHPKLDDTKQIAAWWPTACSLRGAGYIAEH